MKARLFRRWDSAEVRGELYAGQALDFLREIESETAAIVFLDPPFNLGKRYSPSNPKLDSKPTQEYIDWVRAVLAEAVRVLSPGGALYLYHLPMWAMRFGAGLDQELEFRHWISISMKNGFVRGERLYPAHYALLYFTKGKPGVFNRPKVDPVRCRHCDGLVKDYGGYRKIIEEKGINLSDVWDDVSPVRHASRKLRAQNQLPPTIPQRVVQMSGNRGGILVDPFAGTGSSLIAAVNAGMTFRACDVVQDNCSLVASRIDALAIPSPHEDSDARNGKR